MQMPMRMYIAADIFFKLLIITYGVLNTAVYSTKLLPEVSQNYFIQSNFLRRKIRLLLYDISKPQGIEASLVIRRSDIQVSDNYPAIEFSRELVTPKDKLLKLKFPSLTKASKGAFINVKANPVPSDCTFRNPSENNHLKHGLKNHYIIIYIS